MKETLREHREWQARNFTRFEPWECVLGAVEEIGELSHAYLKQHQGGVRMGEKAALREAEVDAVGDVILFLSGYCNARGLDLIECVEVAWEEVKLREPKATYPGRGS